MKRRLQFLHLLVFGLLLAAFGAAAQTPVAYYPFTGNAKDLSGNGNSALVNGATLTQDRFGWGPTTLSVLTAYKAMCRRQTWLPSTPITLR
jgi:hypothetical protein